MAERMTDEDFAPIADRLGVAGECWSVAEVDGEDLVDLVTEARRARAAEAAALDDLARLRAENERLCGALKSVRLCPACVRCSQDALAALSPEGAKP